MTNEQIDWPSAISDISDISDTIADPQINPEQESHNIYRLGRSDPILPYGNT
jgi:hypothetical protein